MLSFTEMETVEGHVFEFRLGRVELHLPQVDIGGRPAAIQCMLAERVVRSNGTQTLNHVCSHLSSIEISFNMSLHTPNKQKLPSYKSISRNMDG